MSTRSRAGSWDSELVDTVGPELSEAPSNHQFVRFLLVDCISRALARRRQLSLPL